MSVQHPIRAEDLELLALGVFSPEESEPLRAHVSSCAECSRNFAEAQGRVALFALAAPPQDPPPSVRENLLRKIRTEKVRADQSASNVSPSREVSTALRWWNTIWVPAFAVLAIATVILWTNDRRMGDQLQKMRDAEQMFENQMHHEQALVAILSAADTKTVSLAPSAKAAKWWADVKYNSRLGMVCYNGDLPVPPPNKEYQMWIVPEVGAPISVGAFMPASFSNGRMCMAKMPQGVTCKDFGVTVEPMGGMPRPTGPVILASAR